MNQRDSRTGRRRGEGDGIGEGGIFHWIFQIFAMGILGIICLLPYAIPGLVSYFIFGVSLPVAGCIGVGCGIVLTGLFVWRLCSGNAR